MNDINTAGHMIGDSVGGLAINLPIGIYGYKLGAGIGTEIMSSQTMDSYALWKNRAISPVNDALTTGIETGKATFSNLIHGKMEMAKTTAVAEDFLNTPQRFQLQQDGTAKLLGSERQAPVDSTLKGELPANEQVSVEAMLKSKAPDQLIDRYNARIASGRQAPLSADQLASTFGPDPNGVSALREFANQHGLSLTEQNASTGLYQLKGSAPQMQEAFGTKLQAYVNDGTGEVFRGRTGTIQTSAQLAPYLEGVYGLDTRPQFKTNFILAEEPTNSTFATPHTADLSADPLGGKGGAKPKVERVAYDPQDVYKAYNFPENMDGTGIKATFSSLGGTLPDGMNEWLAKQGANGGIKVVDLTTSGLKPDPKGANTENALDAGNLKLGLPKAQVSMISADNSDAGFIATIDRAGQMKSTVHSISWGQNEESWTGQGIRGMAMAAKKAALQGTTIVAASGDNGAVDNAPSGNYSTDVPSSLAEITGVGGTKMTIGPNGERASESAWTTNGATGGGISEKVPRPIFQKGFDLPPNANGTTSFLGRGVPDIAFMADRKTSWKVFTDNGLAGVGGTSAAAPAAAVLFGKAAEAMGGNGLGQVNPLLYTLAQKNPGVFWDITTGNNHGYKAGPGWDATTGLGSIDGQKFIDALKNGDVSKAKFGHRLISIPYIGNSGYAGDTSQKTGTDG